MTRAQKISLTIIITIFLFLIIVIAALIGTGNIKPSTEKNNSIDAKNEQPIDVNERPEMKKETKELIDEVQKLAAEAEAKKLSGADIDTAQYGQVVSLMTGPAVASGTEEKKGIIVVPGSSIISLETGEVLTENGVLADNSLDPSDPNSPKQSFSIKDAGVLPESTIRLTISEGKIAPASFKVKAGQAVSIAVTSKSAYGDVFRFEDESLNGVAVGVGGGETRSITFNAPATPGEYLYFSAVRKQKENGATGIMIVE